MEFMDHNTYSRKRTSAVPAPSNGFKRARTFFDGSFATDDEDVCMQIAPAVRAPYMDPASRRQQEEVAALQHWASTMDSR